MIMIELFYYFQFQNIFNSIYIEPSFNFKYNFIGEFFPKLGRLNFHIFLLLGASAYLLLGLGLAPLFTGLFATYFFSYLTFFDRVHFLNHWYLITIITLMITIFSIDKNHKSIANAWKLKYLMILTGVVYFYSGLSKISVDWIIRLEPISTILSNTEGSILPKFMQQILRNNVFVSIAAYSIIVVEIFAYPLLKSKYLRWPTYLFLGAFHILNLIILPIGAFPLLMLLLNTLFLFNFKPTSFKETSKTPLFLTATAIIFFQLIIPLKQYIYKYDKLWTEQGKRLTWHMMTEYKDCSCSFFIYSNNQLERVINQKDFPDVSDYQARSICRRPNLILMYAHHLGENYKNDNPSIYCNCFMSLNNRERQLYVHPKIDLLKEKSKAIQSYDWIIPPKSSLLE